MLKSISTIVTGILGFAVVIFGLGYIQQCTEVEAQEQMNNQLTAYYNDSLTVIEKDNQTLNRRVANLTGMNSDLDNTIENLDNTIFSKNEEIIRLKKLVGSGYGTIDTTIIIDSTCIGLILTYIDTTGWHTIYIKVEVNNPPLFEYEVTIPPIKLTTYLVRDSEGVWTGYAIPDESIKDHITIDSMKVEIAKDEFIDFYDDTNAFKFGPSVSIGSDFQSQKTIFNIGGGILLNETHAIGLELSLNSDWYFARYSYYFGF